MISVQITVNAIDSLAFLELNGPESDCDACRRCSAANEFVCCADTVHSTGRARRGDYPCVFVQAT